MPADLQTCTFVFVRHDAHRTPLQCTYDGPFRVLERSKKFFTLDLEGRRDTVSVDRLKPAFLEADFGLQETRQSQVPVTQSPALNTPPSAPPTPAQSLADRPPLRIVGRSRSGRTLRRPARLD